VGPDRVKTRSIAPIRPLAHREAQGLPRRARAAPAWSSRYFGDDVRKDVAQKLVAGSIHEALEEHKLTPVAPRGSRNGDVKPASPFKYVATVESGPGSSRRTMPGSRRQGGGERHRRGPRRAPRGDAARPRRCSCPSKAADVSSWATTRSPNTKGFVDGAPLRGAKRDNVAARGHPGSLLENKAEHLVGARVGETRELAVGFPQDYTVAELRGKEGRFQVRVKGLKKRECRRWTISSPRNLGGEGQDPGRPAAEGPRGDGRAREGAQGKARSARRCSRPWWRRTPSRRPRRWSSATSTPCSRACWRASNRRGLDVRQLGLNLDRLRDDLRARAALESKVICCSRPSPRKRASKPRTRISRNTMRSWRAS